MLKELFYLTANDIAEGKNSIFSIFQYITFRAGIAAVISILICLVFGPKLINYLTLKKAGQSVRNDGPETHLVKTGTPTMGGLLINISLIISILICQDLRNSFTWLILFSIFGFGVIGFVDDYLKIFRNSSDGLHASYKFTFQVLVSAIIVVYMYYYVDSVYFPFLKNPNVSQSVLYVPFFKDLTIDLSWFYIPLGIFYIVGFSNAINLTDGLDGLAAGLVIFVALALSVLTYLSGHLEFAQYLHIPFSHKSGEISVATMALAGSCMGFLWFNAHPAHIFMGDTGSLMLGGLVAVISLMIKQEILLFVIGGVFVIEVVSVILQVIIFKLTGRRIFKMAPLHHHFELKGWKETQVVIRFWILGGLFVILSLVSLKVR